MSLAKVQSRGGVTLPSDARHDSPVFSKKVAELEAQGISIPNPLPR